MMTSYDIEVDNSIIVANLERIRNQVYACLPRREEGKDYVKPLETLIVELLGFTELLNTNAKTFSLVCKLQGLIAEEVDFMLYRRTIFETCGMINDLIKSCE